jgi:hypothetical protein
MTTAIATPGLTEQEYRESLERELVQAMRSEGGVPTIHAIAHAVARTAELDHLRLADQLAAAGVGLRPAPAPTTSAVPGRTMD